MGVQSHKDPFSLEDAAGCVCGKVSGITKKRRHNSSNQCLKKGVLYNSNIRYALIPACRQVWNAHGVVRIRFVTALC